MSVQILTTSMEQAEASAFASTNEPTGLLRHWFRKGFAMAATAHAVPVGWRAAPIEPTPEMLDAAIRLQLQMADADDEPYHREIYSVMLNAAPTAPAAQPAAPEFWAVMAECGEGVVFNNQADARWTLTGQGTGADGFGFPGLGGDFREIYGSEPLTLYSVRLEPVAATPDAHTQHCSELRLRTAGEKAAYLEGIAEGRMRAARDTAPKGGA